MVKKKNYNKVNQLENNVEYLKSENKEMKKEIGKKDKIILSLKSNQNIINLHHKNVSIGKKKKKIIRIIKKMELKITQIMKINQIKMILIN